MSKKNGIVACFRAAGLILLSKDSFVKMVWPGRPRKMTPNLTKCSSPSAQSPLLPMSHLKCTNIHQRRTHQHAIWSHQQTKWTHHQQFAIPSVRNAIQCSHIANASTDKSNTSTQYMNASQHNMIHACTCWERINLSHDGINHTTVSHQFGKCPK